MYTWVSSLLFSDFLSLRIRCFKAQNKIFKMFKIHKLNITKWTLFSLVDRQLQQEIKED